jgi:hypothetical protein
MLITRSEILLQCQRDKAAFERIPAAMRELLLYEMAVARRTIDFGCETEQVVEKNLAA